MKPYKSNQIRRMPDNTSNVPMKFVTEPGHGPAAGNASVSSKGGAMRDSSQGATSENTGPTKHKF